MSSMNVAKLTTSGDANNTYFIQKNEQNSLKGLLWGSGASVLTSGALTLTGATAVLVAATALGSMGIMINDNLRNSIGSGVPLMLGLAAATAAVDYMAVKFTGFCFSNAIHHLGPEYQIIRQKNGI